MNASTGKEVEGIEHLTQSTIEILTISIGSHIRLLSKLEKRKN